MQGLVPGLKSTPMQVTPLDVEQPGGQGGELAGLLDDLPPAESWGPEECCTWLNAIGLGRYCEAFRKNQVGPPHQSRLFVRR
jgi:hypothetical protein